MNFERKCNRPPERAGAMPTMHDRTDADVAASDPMRASIEELFINMSRWLHNTYPVCPYERGGERVGGVTPIWSSKSARDRFRSGDLESIEKLHSFNKVM